MAVDIWEYECLASGCRYNDDTVCQREPSIGYLILDESGRCKHYEAKDGKKDNGKPTGRRTAGVAG